jgi:Type IV secretion-system coupling protein DNA-binding domain
VGYKQAYGSERTAENIASTLLVQIEKYEPIAALWHKAETVYGNEPVSLTAWTKSSSVLLLGKSETAETEMREINRVIITRLSELLLEQEETREPSTFIILDELASLGNMKPLIKLAEEGRSKGVSLAIGFQAKEHLEKNFSKELANAFLGQFNHIAALRLRDEQTARWISELIGKNMGIRYTSSESTSWGNPKSHTLQEQYYEEYATQISELTSIPPFRPDQGIGLKGLYLGHTYWWHTYSPRIVESLAPKAAVPAVKKSPGEYQEIEPWTEQDYERLNITHLQDISLDEMENFLREDEPEL